MKRNVTSKAAFQNSETIFETSLYLVSNFETTSKFFRNSETSFEIPKLVSKLPKLVLKLLKLVLKLPKLVSKLSKLELPFKTYKFRTILNSTSLNYSLN